MAELLKPHSTGPTTGHRRVTMRASLRGFAPHTARLRSLVHSHAAAESPEGQKAVAAKTGNSYKMNPQGAEKFQTRKVEAVMQEVVEERLREVTYEASTCQQLAKDLAAEVQRRVKDFRWQRYKIVCHVTLGQQRQQGTEVASRCVWDPALDSHATFTFHNNSVFAVVQCYGIYYE